MPFAVSECRAMRIRLTSRKTGVPMETTVDAKYSTVGKTMASTILKMCRGLAIVVFGDKGPAFPLVHPEVCDSNSSINETLAKTIERCGKEGMKVAVLSRGEMMDLEIDNAERIQDDTDAEGGVTDANSVKGGMRHDF